MKERPTTQHPETHPSPPEGRELDMLLLIVRGYSAYLSHQSYRSYQPYS